MPKKTISEAAAEQELAQRGRQVPNYQAPPPTPYPGIEKTTPRADDKSIIASGARQYRAANDFAGVRPQDEIYGEFVRGNYGNAVYNAVVGKPGIQAARNLLQGPKGTVVGGSLGALDANRQQYDQGILAGQDQLARGEGVSMYGADTAATAAGMGGGLYDAGMGMGASGIGGQNRALAASIAAAGQDVGSVARAQQQMATDAQARQMQSMAASARGGNAASALRNAAAQGSANQLQVNQQLAVMRMQEAESRRAAQQQAQQFAAQQYGERAATGYNAANAGAGQVNTAGSTIGGIGSNIMGSGTQNTKTFVDAETEQNVEQAKIDAETQKAKAAHRKGILDMIGKGASMMGGG